MARALHWDEQRLALVDKAALTMNVGSWRLQDQLARHPSAVASAEERAKLDAHPAQGVALLQGRTRRGWRRCSATTTTAWRASPCPR